MANGYIKAAQIIADDQTEVASKLQTLLDAEGIDASELNDFEVTTFGANKFLISILYATLRSVGNLSTKVGLKAIVRTKLGVVKTLTTIIGLKATVFFKFGKKFSTNTGIKALGGRVIWTVGGVVTLNNVF